MIDERDIEGRLFDGVKQRGGMCLKLTSILGIQDRLVLLPGARVYFVETKRPAGGRLSQMQKVRKTQISRLGFPARVIWTDAGLQQFFSEIDAAEVRAEGRAG